MANVMGFVGKVLILVGAALLLYVPYQLWGTGTQTRSAQKVLNESFVESLKASEQQNQEEILVDLSGLDSGDAVARLEIPSIGVNYVVSEGVDLVTLQSGPGHFPDTPLPGQPGNSAIAGHRSTYDAPFNLLNELAPGSEVIVTTLQGRFIYEVIPQQNEDGNIYGHYIVPPTALEILDDKGDNRITLMGCHPRYGSSHRIVVEAKLVTAPAQSTFREPTGPRSEGNDMLLRGPEGSILEAVFWFTAVVVVYGAMFVVAGRVEKQKVFVYIVSFVVLGFLFWKFFGALAALNPVPL